MQNIILKLKKFNYLDKISYSNNRLLVTKKGVELYYDSLFFIDVAYREMHSYFFAISAPKYGIKGVLLLSLDEYHNLATTAFANKFNMEIETNPKVVKIQREYGLRKVYLDEFDSKRFILKKGFTDFPACPYGHTFKALGYDIETKEYVRLERSILKSRDLEIIEFKGEI